MINRKFGGFESVYIYEYIKDLKWRKKKVLWIPLNNFLLEIVYCILLQIHDWYWKKKKKKKKIILVLTSKFAFSINDKLIFPQNQ